MLRNLAAGSVPSAALDNAIREEYRQFSVPVDQIVSHSAIAGASRARIQSCSSDASRSTLPPSIGGL